MSDITDDRLGEIWRENYMRPVSFGRAVALAARSLALEEAAKVCHEIAESHGRDWERVCVAEACQDAIRRLDAGRGES